MFPSFCGFLRACCLQPLQSTGRCLASGPLHSNAPVCFSSARATAGMSVLHLRGPSGEGQSLGGSPSSAPHGTGLRPHPNLAGFSACFVCGCRRKGDGSALQRRPSPFCIQWSLAPGHPRLPVGGEPAPGTSGPASWRQGQRLEALRESGRSQLCGHFGRCFLSTDCVRGRASPAERLQPL